MKRTLVALFLLVLLAPLAINLAGGDGADPTNENREMAPFPQWTGTWRSAVEFPDAFSKWFEDHFGFRARLVRWFGESRWFLLGVSPSSTVIKGRNGWLFYSDDGGIEDYVNKAPLSAPEVSAWHDAITRAQDWLDRRHVGYVFTIAPDKHLIYPEYMPDSIRRVGSVSRMDQVYATLSGTAVATVDTRGALLDAKTREQIYYVTDTHWNERGAFVAYQAIVDAVRRQTPSVPPAWPRSDFENAQEITTGKDLAGMLGMKNVFRETDFRMIPRRPRRARVVDPPGGDPAGDWGRVVTEISDSTLPRAVIFRDSFASRLVPYLSEHFSRAVYLWQNDFDAEVVEKEHPDVVIEEIVGRHLYLFLASPELVPK
jgi:hypothetical protein